MQCTSYEECKFITKLRKVKGKLKNYNKVVFGNVNKEKKLIECRIIEIDKSEQAELMAETLFNERKHIKSRLQKLIFKEEIMWKQKAKASWAKDEDNNTKIFHEIVNVRRNKNMINKMEISMEEQIENSSKIEEKILNYFLNLYSSGEELRPKVMGLNWVLIKEEQAVWLERKFEEEKVKKVIDKCCPDKAPGMNGFTLPFFLSYWEIIKGDVMKVMEEFL